MDAGSIFQKLASDLPDGPIWITGRWLKEKLLKTLDHDRVRAGMGLSELPQSSGRFLSARNADAFSDFQLYDASDQTGTKLGIRFGNVTPNGSALGAGVNPWPQEFTATSIPPWSYVVDVTGTGVAYLIVTVDPGSSGGGGGSSGGAGGGAGGGGGGGGLTTGGLTTGGLTTGGLTTGGLTTGGLTTGSL